jgi:8-oxo-dGTP pyrophosphatase MutT (NUDIX family)/GNAT superfamily N-acetyltransferase
MIKYAAAEILSTEMGGRTTLRHLAHRADFTYTPRPGYLYVRSRAISSRTNDNYDDFPAEEIEKGYRSFIGKPVFVNHSNEDHKRARGVVIAAALHHDINPNGMPDTWCEVLMEVDAVRFPKLAKAIVLGHIDRTSMGVDVEYSICSACGNKATNPAEYCRHIPQMKGSKIVRRNAKTGRPEETLIFETCFGLSFFENSLLVEEPADPTAHFLGVDKRGLEMVHSASVRPQEGLGAFVAAHPDLDEAVTSFKPYATEQGWHDPTCAGGQCDVASVEFAEHLHNRGIPHEVVTHYPKPGGPMSHSVVEVGDHTVDWTARQHDPAADFPHVEPHHVTRSRWHRTEPYYGEIEYGQHKYGGEHMGLLSFVAAYDQDEDLTTKSPGEIDGSLAEHHDKYFGHENAQKSAMDSMHHATGDRQRSQGRRWAWGKTDEEVHNTDPATLKPWDQRSFESAKTRHADAGQGLREEAGHIQRHEDEFSRRGGWSRFFTVQDGHIHSSRQCHSCRPTTKFGWQPELSGKSEKEAVDDKGPYLCTHCFKSAPTEWKRDPTEVKAEEKRQSGGLCPGGTASHYLSHEEVTERKAAHPQGKISLGPGEAHYFGQQKGMLGRCPSCRSLQKVKNSGDFYNHKPPEPPKAEQPKPVVMTPPREEPKPEPVPKSTEFGPGMVDQLPHPTEKKLKSHLHKDHRLPYPDIKRIERIKDLTQAHDEMHDGPNSWVTNGHTHPETKEAGLHAFIGAFPFELRVTAVEISVAGLAVVARDTGRVLMLQRLLDGTDPAGGTWEFPGGHMDEGEAPIEGAIREWKEELGCPLPHGKVGGHWISKGIYQGSVYVIEHEDEVKINDDHEDRKVLNPDDPDGDGIEVAAWWDPKDLPDMPALRPECKNTDWDLFKPSAIEKVAAKSWPDVQWMMEGGSQYLTGVGAEVTHSPGFYETADSNPEDRHRVRKVIHQINRSKPLSDVLYHGHTEDQDSFTERHKVGDEMHIPLMATTPQKQLAHAYGTPASHTRPNGSQNSNQSVIYHFHQPKSVHVRDNERVISGRYRITGIEDGDEVPHSGGQLAFDERGHPKISGDKVETMPPKRRKNVHLDYQGPLQVHPEEPQSYDDDDDYGHEAGLNGFIAVDVQDRLFDVKQYPTKKGPYQEPKRNPEFEQPNEGIIGKYLYHHSPPENRASIMEHGLQPHDPQESSAKGSDIPEEDTPHGVYLGPYDSISPHKSHHDIWAVDSNQVHLHHDPDDRENYWGFHYSEHPIPPDAMHLVHRAGEEHTAGLWAFAADASEFYHGTSDELAPGAQLSVEEAAKQQPEVAQALEHQGGQHISFTTDYKHAEMYAGIRAQTRGGTPHVYRVRPTGGYEPNPADEKWREGKPPMSFRTREPVTVLGEATPPKRRRKKAGLEAFAMDETGDPPTAHIPTAMERWQGETVHQPIAAAWKAMGAPMGAGAKDQYPERYEPNKGFGVHLKNGETETKSSTSPEGVASQYDVTPVSWADRDKHEIETGMPSMSYPDGVPRINAKVPGSERPLDHVYRIMHDDEYQQAKQRGYFKSDERMNLSNEGTVASEGSTGSFYAAPGPNRIVRLQHHPEDGWKRDSDNYIKTHQKIPFHRADLISPIIHNHQEIKGDPKRSHSVVDNFHIEGLEHEAPHLQHQASRPNIGKGWWLTPEGKKISVYDHYETTPGMARQMIRPHMADTGQVRVRSYNNQLNVQTSRPFTDPQRKSLLMDADRHSKMFVDVLHPDTEESIHSESGGPEDAERMLARAHRAAIPHIAKLAATESHDVGADKPSRQDFVGSNGFSSRRFKTEVGDSYGLTLGQTQKRADHIARSTAAFLGMKKPQVHLHTTNQDFYNKSGRFLHDTGLAMSRPGHMHLSPRSVRELSEPSGGDIHTVAHETAHQLDPTLEKETARPSVAHATEGSVDALAAAFMAQRPDQRSIHMASPRRNSNAERIEANMQYGDYASHIIKHHRDNGLAPHEVFHQIKTDLTSGDDERMHQLGKKTGGTPEDVHWYLRGLGSDDEEQPKQAKLAQQEHLFDPGTLGHVHLPNPKGGFDWHHGTPHKFEDFGQEREDEDDPYGGYDFETGEKFKQPHWNTHLGQHWTSLHGVAEHFAKGQYGQAAEGKGHVITANLGIKHPKDYNLESDMDKEAFEHNWDGHDPHDYHDEFCHNPEHRDDPNEEHFDDEPYHYNDEHQRGDEVDRQVKQRYIDRQQQGEWLSQHPNSEEIAHDFKERAKTQGHDGITYGNELEGPHGHQCAITFDPAQIHNARRQALGLKSFVAELSEEGRVSVAEQIMERGGHGGRDWYIPRLHQDDPTRQEQHKPVHDFVHGVLAANGHNPEMTPHVRVVPEHWDLRGGAQGSTDGMNYIGVHSHTNDLTLLHETAHILTRTPEGPGGHGPEFRSTVQKLYHDHISPEAGQMFGELANPPQAHEAMAWQEQGGRGGMTAEQAGARSVRDAGFKGYVGQSNWDEDEGGDDTHHFDEDLYDKVTPEPTPEEEEHYQKHDDYPDSYMERHDQAYSDALGKKQQEDEPDHTDDHLHHWIAEHSQDANEWRKHAKQPQQVDLRKGVYATQSHVGQFHIDRYLHGGEDEPSWHSQSGGQAHDYLGESHPLFVTHQGRLHAIEGHHRIAAALQRGDSHIQGWHHDLDKHPIAGYDKQGNGCEDCEGYYDWDKDEHHLATYHDTGQWEEPPRTLPNGDSVSGYGDAVPGGYNESLRAFHPDTREETGRLDVNTARHDPEHLVAWMHTPEEHRGRGTMTHLLEHYRQHHLPPGEHLNFGMTTPEGQAWIDKHQPKTAADDEEWRGQHQPSMGPPIHNLLEKDEDGGQLAPDDIYTHMHYYSDGEPSWDSESHAAIQAARGDRPLHQRPAAPAKMFSERAGGGEMSPAREAESDESFARRKQRRADGEHHVTIYRAAPKGLKTIGPGDWVTPSPSYARDHARHATDPKKDWPVYKARVPAKHVRWAGDSLNEFGYNGPEVKPTYHTRGGTQAERLAAFVVEADQPYGGGYQFKFRPAKPNSMEAQADKTLNYHRLDAFHENTQDLTQGRGGHAGFLLWHHKTGEIGSIETLPEHQRRGLATEMLDQARQIASTTRGVKPPKHSNQRTDAGEAWARSTGDRLPRRVQGLADFALSGAS